MVLPVDNFLTVGVNCRTSVVCCGLLGPGFGGGGRVDRITSAGDYLFTKKVMKAP